MTRFSEILVGDRFQVAEGFMANTPYTKTGISHAEWYAGIDHFFPDEAVVLLPVTA